MGAEKSRPKATLLGDLGDYRSLWSRSAVSPLQVILRFPDCLPPVQSQGPIVSRDGI